MTALTPVRSRRWPANRGRSAMPTETMAAAVRAI